MPLQPLQRLVVVIALLLTPVLAHAASVTVEPRANYQRLSFSFATTARMKVKVDGATVTLSFSQPVKASVADIKSQVGSHATAVTRSNDGKTIVLTLSNPERIRQFVSGNNVGIDIFGKAATTEPTPKKSDERSAKKSVTPTPEKPKSASMLTTKKTPETPSNVPFKKPLVIKPVRGPVSKAVPVTPVEQAEAPAPVTAVQPSPKTKDVPTKPAQPANVYTTKETPAKAAAPTTAPSEASPPEAKKAAAPVAEPPATHKVEHPPKKPSSFLITTQKTKEGLVLNFPWSERTAAAIFERPHGIWIIFSREADAKTELLATVMPKQVTRVQQYAYPGALVLRLSTDGTIHATSSQPGKNYEWNVTLGNAQPKAALDTSIHADATGDKHYLRFDAYDVGEPLAFFDPLLQDRLVVVPTFEAGRGVAEQRSYPEFSVLATPQGIAIASQRDDLVAEALRQGVKLTSPNPLALSQNLPPTSERTTTLPEDENTSGVMLPYDQWYIDPKEFANQRTLRLQTLVNATGDATPSALMRVVALYLQAGMGQEAGGYLHIIKQSYPDFYVRKKLALLSAVSSVLMNRLPEAASAVAAKELDTLEEAQLWRELIAMLAPATTLSAAPAPAPTATQQEATPTPPPATPQTPAVATAVAAPPLLAPQLPFDFMKYNKAFIRSYPPHIRQRIAQMAADANLKEGKENEALEIYDTLGKDGILGVLESEAELIVAAIAVKKEKTKEALEIYKRLSTRGKTPRAMVAARFQHSMLEYAKGKIDADTAIANLERVRFAWRGDTLEADMLSKLTQLYSDAKRYDGTLRTLKATLEAFPTDPNYIKTATSMSELFENLFLHGQADDMPPLKSLALFYEFRQLTPIGERGDGMIQKLADRLAAVDLLDRATQLLENQIRFRVSGEERARIGARLALLYLINQQPEKAITTIQISNFSGSTPELPIQRNQIAAKALSTLGKNEEALSLLTRDKTPAGNLLRLEILWNAKDWPNVINQSEDILSSRVNLTAPLTNQETDILLKLVLGYNFEGDHTQLKYLRDYYQNLIPDSNYKQIFDYLTNDTTPLSTEDYTVVAKQIGRTESFIDIFKQKIAQGKLSETVK